MRPVLCHRLYHPRRWVDMKHFPSFRLPGDKLRMRAPSFTSAMLSPLRPGLCPNATTNSFDGKPLTPCFTIFQVINTRKDPYANMYHLTVVLVFHLNASNTIVDGDAAAI